MDEREQFEDLELALEGVSDSLAVATSIMASFDGEVRRFREGATAASKDVSKLERSMSSGLRSAMDGLVLDGDRLSDVFQGLAKSMVDNVFSSAVDPVSDALGGLFSGGVSDFLGGLLPFADGSAFSQGRVMPFASGGIVQGATMFPMRGGLGLMGEAGPEAIMPLARGADGRLGVRGSGGTTNVTINVSTPDAQSFQRSEGQIAAQMSRALGRANRNR